MDYRSFFADVTEWMTASNHMIGKYPIDSQEYWDWVVNSTGQLTQKYNNHPLVIRQMDMLISWLEDAMKKEKGGQHVEN